MPPIDLDDLTKNYKIFVDTCSLMNDGSKALFLNCLNAFFQKNATKLFIPSKVIAELTKFSQDPSNLQRQKKAMNGLAIVSEYRTVNILDERGEENEPFADGVFQFVFSKFIVKYNLCLITNDKALAFDILGLTKRKSVSTSKALRVFYVRPDGTFGQSSYDYLATQFGNGSTPAKNRSNQQAALPQIRKFALAKQVTSVSNTPLPVTHIPGLNEEVILGSGQTDRLTTSVASGGEGSIFVTDKGNICKIYFPHCLTRFREEKVNLMVSNRIAYEGICWPIEKVFNSQKEFVGFTMPKAFGKSMQTTMFVKPLLQKNFPQWTKKNLVTLGLTILNKIKYLHDRNVILGDINPLNILIKDDSTVFFVDTDSYQIEGFPCPVGTVNFTPPERQGLSYDTFLRSFDDENFAIATLVFMILLPGKPPYSQLGGANPAENIKGMNFSYPFKSQSNKKYPDGPWRFIWSHLPYKMKEAFYGTFRENKRKPVTAWLDLLENYLYSLEKGHVSEEIFPRTLKEVSDYARQEFNITQEQGLDRNGKPKIQISCMDCGKVYFVPEEIVQKMQASNTPPRCFDCREAMQNTGEALRCVQCRKEFLFSKAEAEFFRKKGLSKPKKCEICRKRAKAGYQHRQPVYVPAPQPRRRDSWCFITSAVMAAMNKPDDCQELVALRAFRDKRMAWSKYDSLLEDYYVMAPKVVEAIERHPCREAIYQYVYEWFIAPIVSKVDRVATEETVGAYCAMVEYLKQFVEEV